MAKLLYVVHRYAPYPGGSEYNTQRYAEASLKLGHQVTVLAGTHQGNYNGVEVTSNLDILSESWDLIIVHGSTGFQNIALQKQIPFLSPMLYLIIRAEVNSATLAGLRNAKYVGCATIEDSEFAISHGFRDKIIEIKYPIPDLINPQITIDYSSLNLTKEYIFLSCGGWAPHKGMQELVEVFCELKRDDVELVLTGYDTGHGIPDFMGYGASKGKKIQQFDLQDESLVHHLMKKSHLYIWNSIMGSEGYGLVLLEAMLQQCQWIGRNMVAARTLHQWGFGQTYTTPEELYSLMENYKYVGERLNYRNYIIANHSPELATKEMLSKAGI